MSLRLFVFLLLVVVANLGNAATFITDDAHLLTDAQIERLDGQLAESSVPIYVVTCVNAGKPLREVAGQILAKHKNRGFAIVVQTEPREWRISEAPASMVAPDVIESIGTGELASAPRNGETAGALLRTAKRLEDAFSSGPREPGMDTPTTYGVTFVIILAIVLAVCAQFLSASRRSRYCDDDDSILRNPATTISSSASD